MRGLTKNNLAKNNFRLLLLTQPQKVIEEGLTRPKRNGTGLNQYGSKSFLTTDVLLSPFHGVSAFFCSDIVN